MQFAPKVTIIIPAYNAANFLNQAIDCAVGQTYRNIEIMVVNDGSPDDGATERIALSYGDKIRYVKKENGGVSSVLNLALREMTGEWFSWLSHDDLYYPEKIEKQVAYLNKLKTENPNLDLAKIALHTATESIDRGGKVIKRPSYADVSEKEDFLSVVIGSVFNYRLSGCSFLLPRACFFDVGGFREDIRTVSDVEYWYRLAFSGYQFYCMKNDVLVKNRSHGKQVGKTKVALFEKELNELHIDIADRLFRLDLENKKKVFRDLYRGMVFRGMRDASRYVKKTYLSKLLNRFELAVVLPLVSTAPLIKGKIRMVARCVYRKINVK